ncbi:MAG: peptide chain release factor 1 [Trueperaceae bacterium]|nr:MAG: peptide chain release factor 1 [Trueperaceae bacterium]
MSVRVEPVIDEFEALEACLGDPTVIADQPRYRALMRRYGELKEAAETARALVRARRERADTEALLDDPEVGATAREELEHLATREAELERSLQRALVPRDPFDDDDVIVEVRAAAGGDEASLFAAELVSMYQRYAESLGFTVEPLDTYPTELGGVSKAAFEVRGRGPYQAFKYESGVHRVQRVPVTEAQGRIHTSTVTVAVLPVGEDAELVVSPADYRVDVYRASGPGGQSVNTTDSAVRITYMPGTPEELVVTCQDGKSQHKNKEKALTVLRARLLERERERSQAEEREARLVQIGSGERSEKIRTYNVPQSRVTDHRIGFTTHDLAGVLAGELGPLTAALSEADQERRASELGDARLDAVAIDAKEARRGSA